MRRFISFCFLTGLLMAASDMGVLAHADPAPVAPAAPSAPAVSHVNAPAHIATPSATATMAAMPKATAAKAAENDAILPTTNNDIPVVSLMDDNHKPLLVVKRGHVIGEADYPKACEYVGKILQQNPRAFVIAGLIQTIIRDHGTQCDLPEVDITSILRPQAPEAPHAPAALAK